VRRFALLTALALTGLLAGSADLSRPLVNDAYIWQRIWTPSLRAAMSESRDLVQSWRVLAAEADATGMFRLIKVDHQALGGTGKPAIAVFRIDGQLARWDEAVLLDGIAATLADWKQAGTTPAGVEIDYDCATARLGDYAQFLFALRQRISSRLSITALPTWLEARAFRDVLRPIDEVVLQVHSVQSPEEGLFTGAEALDWARRMGALTGKPFRLALADYGSRISLGQDGRIFSIESETPKLTGAAFGRDLTVDPREVAETVRTLERRPPGNLTGIVWFRLPTDADRRTWSLATWRAVIDGSSAQAKATIELRASETAGLFYVTLANTERRDAVMPARIRVNGCEAADGANGYGVERTADGWTFERAGGAILKGQKNMVVGWARCIEGAHAS